MEVEAIYYKAKDGKIFTDPLLCEEYEKTIDIIPGSVGELVKSLEEFDPDEYIVGVVIVKENDKVFVHLRCTANIDNYLEDFVVLDDLTEKQRNFHQTIGELKNTLSEYNKDLPCQYTIVFSKNIDMSDCGVMANYNKRAWREKTEITK